MDISELIEHLQVCKEEYSEADCKIGVNPKSLMIIMGDKTVLLKLDGDWE